MTQLLLEVGDVARVINRSPAMVRALANAGRLRVAAITPRGTRLFRRADIEFLRRPRGDGRTVGGQR